MAGGAGALPGQCKPHGRLAGPLRRPAVRPAAPVPPRRPGRPLCPGPRAVLDLVKKAAPGVGTSNGARPGPDAPALEAAIVENLQFGLGVPPAAISGGVDARTAYRGVAASVRERLIEGFNATQDFWRCEGRGTAAWGLSNASGR